MSKREDIIAEIALIEELTRRETEPLRTFKPYKKQLEFYASTLQYPETCLIAANQVGKTRCAAQCVAYHLTGEYPDDWEGLRFDEPVVFWVSGETGEVIRDTSQKYLFGRPGEFDNEDPTHYTGIVP